MNRESAKTAPAGTSRCAFAARPDPRRTEDHRQTEQGEEEQQQDPRDHHEEDYLGECGSPRGDAGEAQGSGDEGDDHEDDQELQHGVFPLGLTRDRRPTTTTNYRIPCT